MEYSLVQTELVPICTKVTVTYEGVRVVQRKEHSPVTVIEHNKGSTVFQNFPHYCTLVKRYTFVTWGI